MRNHKIIGTLMPLTALLQQKKSTDTSLFETGYEFLDWLKKTDQSAWQLLPLHETQLETGSKTKHVPSPYKSYGIGLDPRFLYTTSLREGTTKQSGTGLPRFARNDENCQKYIAKHEVWIRDYGLFCALRDHFGTDDWTKWDKGLVIRDKETLEKWQTKLKKSVEFFINEQWELHRAYAKFHERAKSLGIALIGDLPYYPSFRSPLVWAHQNVFQINEDRSLPFVSGIPTAPTTHFGRQVWGHPLYNWDEKKEEVLTFWKMRLVYLSSIFDRVRFDHAKAFFIYGMMDMDHPENDHYKEGPGREVFESLIRFGQQQGLNIFVEDSGDHTHEIRHVIAEMNIAGLRIFRFALSDKGAHPRYAEVKNYPEHCVAYTTTHDTETLLGYIKSLTPDQRHHLSQLSGIPLESDEKVFAQKIRDAVIASPANLVIIPVQDWLLTTDRINVPGTEKEIGDTNWHYFLDGPIKDFPLNI